MDGRSDTGESARQSVLMRHNECINNVINSVVLFLHHVFYSKQVFFYNLFSNYYESNYIIITRIIIIDPKKK